MLFVATLMIPGVAHAHGQSTDGTDNNTMMGPMMMHTDEVGVETHEQMQEYMHELFSGDLSEKEATQMAEIMRENHEAFRQDRNSWMGSGMHGAWNTRGGMMGMSGLWGIWGWLVAAAMLVWLTVGVLLVAFLIKKLRY